MYELLEGIQQCWEQYGTSYLIGARNTLICALIGTVVGCLIGFVVGLIQTIPSNKTDPFWKKGPIALLKAIMKIYVEVFRGTPMIVQGVFIYYGARMMFGLQPGIWSSALFVVSINTGAYMAETVRGGILSIDPGQTEGAKAIGMNHVQTMVNVILPQAFRNIVPQIGNNFIINIKDTSVLSVISFTDLFYAHKVAVGALYLYFPSATIVMMIYLTMTLLSSFLLRLLENHLDGGDSFDLATKDTLAHTSGMVRYPKKAKKIEGEDAR